MTPIPRGKFCSIIETIIYKNIDIGIINIAKNRLFFYNHDINVEIRSVISLKLL